MWFDSQGLNGAWSERGEAFLQRSIVDVGVGHVTSLEIPEISEAPTKLHSTVEIERCT